MTHGKKLAGSSMHRPTAPSDRAKHRTGGGFNGGRLKRRLMRKGRRGGRY